jgi:inosine-uridine nucleoside N-ribohydrolase
MKTLIFVCFLLGLSTLACSKERVWIDLDLGIGKPFRDVDDAFALYHALLSQDTLQIEGISFVFGNTDDLDHMRDMAEKIIRKTTSKKIQTFTGAKNNHQLFLKTPASTGLREALKQGPLTIISMGRLTNIATTLYHNPILVKNIRALIVNAGREVNKPAPFGRKEIIFPDTNIDGDIKAAQYIVNLQLPLVMIPVESMRQQIIKKEYLRFMRRYLKAGAFLAKRSRIWFGLWRLFMGAKGFIPWDVFLVSYLTHPQAFSCNEEIIYKMKWSENDINFILRKNKNSHKYILTSYPPSYGNGRGIYCYRIESSHTKNLIQYWQFKESIIE